MCFHEAHPPAYPRFFHNPLPAWLRLHWRILASGRFQGEYGFLGNQPYLEALLGEGHLCPYACYPPARRYFPHDLHSFQVADRRKVLDHLMLFLGKYRLSTCTRKAAVIIFSISLMVFRSEIRNSIMVSLFPVSNTLQAFSDFPGKLPHYVDFYPRTASMAAVKQDFRGYVHPKCLRISRGTDFGCSSSSYLLLYR